MRKDAPFAVGETYHLYNRGAHKQSIFTTDADYKRFLLLLHLANDSAGIELREVLKKYKDLPFSEIFAGEKPDKSLVDIYAYCLMPNHFHLVLQEKREGGITKFTRKVLTGYSMYFNIVHKHSGILAQGAFKSRRVGNGPYFRYIFAYVHLNPLSLNYKDWERRGISDIEGARKTLHEYSHSSFYDYSIRQRPERSILAYNTSPDFLRSQNDLEELLKWYALPEFPEV